MPPLLIPVAAMGKCKQANEFLSRHYGHPIINYSWFKLARFAIQGGPTLILKQLICVLMMWSDWGWSFGEGANCYFSWGTKKALSGRESRLIQTFRESCEQLDVTHPSVHMTQRFAIQGCPTLKMCCLHLQNRLDCDKNQLDCDKNWLDLLDSIVRKIDSVKKPTQ